MIDVNGQELKIVKVMGEFGDEKDASLMMNLRDAQAILHREGKINMITALNCKCKGGPHFGHHGRTRRRASQRCRGQSRAEGH